MSLYGRSAFGRFSFSVLIPCLAIAALVSSCGPMNGSSNLEEITHEGDEPPPRPLTAAEQAELAKFVEPSTADRAHIASVMDSYSNLDPDHEVPPELLEKAVTYFDANKAHIANKDYISVIDFKRHSSSARFYVISMSTGQVWKLHVAHGKNSDPNDDGYADKFSNTNNSEMSSLGFYMTAETYNGKHGLSLRLDGLSSTNSNVRARAIVLHGASYVYDSDKKAGRSWGCPAIPMADRDRAVKQLKGGSLIYAGLSQ